MRVKPEDGKGQPSPPPKGLGDVGSSSHLVFTEAGRLRPVSLLAVVQDLYCMQQAFLYI